MKRLSEKISWAVLPGLLVFFLCGCEGKKYEEPIEGNCHRCHGDKDSAAPPGDTSGRRDAAEIGVGAHRSHLGISDWHAQISCSECHVIPEYLDSEGHVDSLLPAELVWGPLATKDGAAPMFNRGNATCSGGYCHGALLSGRSLTEVTWTIVDGSQAACGTCHGLPPDLPHPQNGTCYLCHSTVINRDFTFGNPSLHIDGEVEFSSAGECSDCHGSDLNPAPPVDTSGGSSTTEMTVGAHQSHLADSPWHRPVACGECHAVPGEVLSPGHIDPPPAELNFSGVAVADDAHPVLNLSNQLCAGVYCHGATLISGGYEPKWTVVGGTEARCGSCHGLPPVPPHPDNADCGFCHMGVIQDGVFIDPMLHIDGMVDFN